MGPEIELLTIFAAPDVNTVIVILLLVAVVGEGQTALEVITTEIMEPAGSEVTVYVGLFEPTFVAPFFH